jgi:uncharacterized protein
MEQPFLLIYDYFKKNRVVLYGLLAALFTFFFVCSFQITLEEDVSRFFPNNKKVEKLNQVFQNSKLMERLVVMVSLKDSTASPAPDSLVVVTSDLVAQLQTSLRPYIKKITHQADDDMAMKMLNSIYANLPIFLEESDYKKIDSLTKTAIIKSSLEENYRQLVSPSGIVMKRMIMQDPIGISSMVLKKLQGLQYDDNFELYDNHIVTKNHRYLLFFIQPKFQPNDTGHNTKFVAGLRSMIDQVLTEHKQVQVHYFGATSVAAGNAQQLRSDTILTVSLMMVALIFFLIWFFKRKRAPLLILFPVVFGGLFSLCCVYLLKGSVSVLALAAGSIILGIAVNYSLHFFTHLRHAQNNKEVIKELVRPMTIGSATTVLAFFCLQFANAGVLKDLGLFAGFSLVGAAFCSLVFLPHFIDEKIFSHSGGATHTWIDRLSLYNPEYNKYLVAIIFLLTPAFFYFAVNVKFNSDMNRLNFMSTETRQAQKELDKINEFSLRSVYLVADGTTLNQALQNSEQVAPLLSKLKEQGIVKKISSVSSFIISDSLQQVRLNRWNKFWTDEKKKTVLEELKREGKKLKFSSTAFENFDSLLQKKYSVMSNSVANEIRTNFFDDFITEQPESSTIVTLLRVDPAKKEALYQQLSGFQNIQAVDKQLLTTMFVELVRADFNFIVTFTSLLVFVALLISYGRLELALMTFIPMMITWIWILGIMALLDIEFNIINVMISTFIFGLGDDYSIFIMDGLQQQYQYGRKSLPAIKTSIFLSAITTITGLGVLIFAQHPALKSIASISIIGIGCVFVMSQTLEPFLFRLMISAPAARLHSPRTAWGTVKSLIPYTYFTLGAIVIGVVGFVMLKVWPFHREQMKLAYHYMLKKVTGWTFPLSFSGKKKVIYHGSPSFDKPAVIISNHQSILDILATVSLTSKILLVTNEWVWRSPVFGYVVRLAEYYPVVEGTDQNINRMRERVQQGYSIMIFPEGKRSVDGQMKRFHKGAFLMAQQLGIDISPLLIHGSGDLIPKGEFYVEKGTMTMKFLPRISATDNRFGETYSERAKNISRYFKEEYEVLARQLETPSYFRRKLISNYLFKGPVLEWYLRVKLNLEKNYEIFNQLVPRQGSILDLGCGYGFLCYMLQFTSKDRQIVGVDYDTEKITTAKNCYSKTDQVNFETADITQYALGKYDCIILSDVLHYLTAESQILILRKCFAAIQPHGKIIVREGVKDIGKRHFGTELTEFFSVKLLRFNKSTNALSFLSKETIVSLAKEHNYETEIIDNSRLTSNIVFVLKRKD